jgi:hypothetical protein
MKTMKFKAFLFAALMVLVLSSCKKSNNLGTPGTVNLNALSSSGIKAATIPTATGSISLKSGIVEIQNLRIEENTGNDNQSGNQVGGSDNGTEKSTNTEGTDGGDIFLAGPYVLNIVDGKIAIDNVQAQPGNYKKVDFDFLAGKDNGGNSVVLEGDYTNSLGSVIPFKLSCNFEGTVQLPLASNITVSSGSVINVAIVFNVANWLSALDFTNATETDGKIVINNIQNASMYSDFVTALSKNIDAEVN